MSEQKSLDELIEATRQAQAKFERTMQTALSAWNKATVAAAERAIDAWVNARFDEEVARQRIEAGKMKQKMIRMMHDQHAEMVRHPFGRPGFG